MDIRETPLGAPLDWLVQYCREKISDQPHGENQNGAGQQAAGIADDVEDGMENFKTLEDAIALATFAHRNQKDKAGLSYIDHPRRVLAKVQAQGALPYVQIAAILHDVTEDTSFTPEMLLALGFSEAAVEVVRLLDRNYSSFLFDKENWGRDVGGVVRGKNWYIALGESGRDDFYYTRIKENPGALIVKKADIEDNLSTWRLSYLPYETQARLIRKYEYALETLNAR